MQPGYPAPGGYSNATNSSPASTAATGTAVTANKSIQLNGGRFDFDDGGTYCGGWEDGKAHGHGVCTGPKGQGAYCGSWHFGFEVSGVYTWPSGSSFEGQWQNGKRHGMGIESRGRWIYRGEWTLGFKGRYGVRQSTTSNAKYEGTWANGLQDGYGCETYADGGTYQGQWLRGMRHGYGVRASAPFGLASHYRPKQTLRASLTSLRSNDGVASTGAASSVDPAVAAAERDRRIDDSRGGFVLMAGSEDRPQRRRSLVDKTRKSILSGLGIRKQRSTGDLEKRTTSGGSIRSNASSTSWMSTESSQSGRNGGSLHTDSNASFVVEDEHMDSSVTETYMGEWKNDKRSGFGMSERTDGLRYEGEWFNNKKYGYGVTIHRDGSREEGKYKNNVLVTSQKKKHIFLMRSAKFRERIDAAVSAAQRASKIALQKADIAISRMATARGKAELANTAAFQARDDFELARITAKQFAPDFTQPNLDRTQLRDVSKYKSLADEKLSDSHINQSSSTNFDLNANAHPIDYNSTDTQLPARSQPSSASYHPRQSLSQFQPKSLYAQRDNFRSGSPSASSPDAVNFYKNQYYLLNQTEQIHSSQNPPQVLPSSSSSTPPPPLPSASSSRSNPYMFMNSRPMRLSVDQSSATNVLPQPSGDDSIPSHLQSKSSTNYAARSNASNIYQMPMPPPPDKQPQNTNTFPINSSHISSANSMAGGYRGDTGFNGYRSSVDYSNQTPNAEKIAALNRLDFNDSNESKRHAALRRNSKPVTGESPYSFKQAMSDHFDHYTRPPSRDSSVDRYTRAASRLSGNSRQPSVDRIKSPTENFPTDQNRSGFVPRSTASISSTGNGSVVGPGTNANICSNRVHGTNNFTALPFEDVIIRHRNLGQEIVPSPVGQPKRTESLYVSPHTQKESHSKTTSIATQIQRKKSMPDFQLLPNATTGMSREEVSVLSSARREEMRRLQEQNERLRANPLLYLVSPHVKEWFSRQQLLILVLFMNISLAFVFYKLLTS